jgi:hypothetical protein
MDGDMHRKIYFISVCIHHRRPKVLLARLHLGGLFWDPISSLNDSLGLEMLRGVGYPVLLELSPRKLAKFDPFQSEQM